MDEFDLDLDEVNEINDVYKVDSRSHDRRICICGHAISRHHYNHHENAHYCKPGQLSCPCIQATPVLEVPNTRYFMRKSLGSGKMHALSRGVAASIVALGDEFTEKKKWLVDEVCQICKEPSKFYPVQLTKDGKMLLPVGDEDEGLTAFLCSACRETL